MLLGMRLASLSKLLHLGKTMATKKAATTKKIATVPKKVATPEPVVTSVHDPNTPSPTVNPHDPNAGLVVKSS